MKLLEVASIEELTPRHVTQLQRLVPRAIHPAAVDAATTVPARRSPARRAPLTTPAVKAAAADLG